MAQVFVSPGVYSNEIDESFIPAGAGAIGAALVGLTEKGQAFIPTVVGNFGDFRNKFGNMNTKMYVPYAARSILRNSDSLLVTRLLGRNTASVGAACLLAFPATGVTAAAALSASNHVLGILRFRGSTTSNIMVSGVPTNFSISSAALGTSFTNLSLRSSDPGYVKKVFGTDPLAARSGDALTAVYVDAVFNWNVDSVTGTVSAATNAGYVTCVDNGSTQITGGFSPATTPMIVSQNFAGQVYDLFRVQSLGHGNYTNTDIKISISNVNLTLTSNPTFSLYVRSFNDSDANPEILESFTNLSLQKGAKNYIGRVIGDRRTNYDFSSDPPVLTFDGEFPNNSQYIRVLVEEGMPAISRPSGFKGISAIRPTPIISALPTVTNELNGRLEVDSNVFMGIDFSKEGVKDRIKFTTTSASGGASAELGMLFSSTASDSTVNVSGFTVINMVGSNSANFSSINSLRFTVPMFSGFDGLDPRVDMLTSSNDGTLSADFVKAFSILSNQDEYDFNTIAAPDAWSSSVGSLPARLIDMVASRGDAFAIVDLAPGTTTASGVSTTVAQAQVEADKFDSNYGAAYYPWIRINDIDNDQLVWVPPSVELMGVYAFNDRVSQPWFAPAGFNRGGLENVLEARRRLSQGDRDALYDRNVNPIATFSGQGIVVFGQKTLQKKASVMDRVNVRRMMLTVRKTIAGFSRVFIFEPNDVSSRNRLLQIINSYLQTVQQQQGLVEFRAVLDETTTTPDLIDRNIMKGKIFLKPTTAAEIVLLDFAVTRQGAVFTD